MRLQRVVSEIISAFSRAFVSFCVRVVGREKHVMTVAFRVFMASVKTKNEDNN